MKLEKIRKSKRGISLFFLANIVSQILIPLKGFSINNSSSVNGSGSPISASLSSMVDGYTGDFRYSVPLINIPGPNGENVPVSANYHAGIGVNQQSSWLGLGWDYNPGEITRQVVSAPDDYRGLLQIESQTSGSSVQRIAKFGSLYYHEFNNIFNTIYGSDQQVFYKSADIKTIYRTVTNQDRDGIINGIENPYPFNSAFDYKTVPEGEKWMRNSQVAYRFRRHMSPHKALAYDNYSVSGPVSGNLKLYALGETKIHDGKHNKYTTFNLTGNKKPNFHFEGSSTNNIDLVNRTNSSLVNQSTNQIHSGTYVKYFTNHEINDNSNLFNNMSGKGFLEYKPTTSNGISTSRRTENPDLIGAFQITDNSGVTYHYSLPVYSFMDLNYNWPLNSSVINFSLIKDKYASSWKLTAVTGPDYQDSNNNFTVDEGDKGYWIAYNYSLWASDYMWSGSRFGFKTDNSIKKNYNSFVTNGYMGNQYYRSGSNASGHSEKYYLNFIKTSTHTAFFVKSVRLDEQCYNPNPSDNSFKPTPLLKLDKIVLMRNEDKAYLINNVSLSQSDMDTRFSFGVCSDALSDVNFVNKSRYDINKVSIDDKALKIVELESDYCLAKNYSGNINNTFANLSYSTISFNLNGYTSSTNLVRVYSKTFQNSSDVPNSGKLTLKKINYYELNGQKITPSIDFGYDENNALKNPDHNENKTDWWGFYKMDYNGSNFVTDISKDDVDAWSLKRINTSLGGQIDIQYESDRYHKEGFYDAPSFERLPCNMFDNWYRSFANTNRKISLNKPHLIFPLQSVSENAAGQISNTQWDSDTPYNVDSTFLMYNYESTYNHSSTGFLRQLVRKGNETGSSTLSGSSFNSDFQERDVLKAKHTGTGALLSNATHNTQLTNNYGVNYKLYFCSFLYGGGVRVKQISVTEPFNNNSYTQKFEYGDGYCAVVPKTLELASANGPSPYDLVMSTKSLINSSVNSKVGYGFMKQTSINQNGVSNGFIVQTYFNSPIAACGSVPNGSVNGNGTGGSKTFHYNYASVSSPNYVSGCNVNGFPTTGGTYSYLFYLNLFTTDLTAKQLGLLMSTSIFNTNNIEVSKTQYTYSASTITEKFILNEGVTDNFTHMHTWTLPPNLAGQNCTEKGFTTISRDTYQYDFSLVHNNSIYLVASSTTKDGITISENIVERDSYTSLPKKVKITDPTQGIFEKYTTYAYSNNPSIYPTFGLKTVNEQNKNLLALIENSKTIKSGKYIISESNVTYSNSYPTRIFDISGNKYITTNVTHPWYRLNETYTRTLDDDVLISATPQASDYRKTSHGTLYDSENNRIEEEGLNGRKVASKWGYNNLYKLADISNANYNSFTFSSFEDQKIVRNTPLTLHFGGEIDKANYQSSASTVISNGNTVLVTPHTGKYMVSVPNNDFGPEFTAENFEVGRTYTAKVWVHKTSSSNASLSIDLTGSVNLSKSVLRSDASNISVGDWVLMSVDIDVPQNFNLSQPHSLKVSTSNFNGGSQNIVNAFFDDLSFHPKDAVIVGNVYDEHTGLLKAQLDNENFATLYNYDNAGRVVSTYKEYSVGIKKVSESQYHFAKP